MIIHMNIYITKQNEAYLRSLPTNESMSGLINRLIGMAREQSEAKKTTKTKIASDKLKV